MDACRDCVVHLHDRSARAAAAIAGANACATFTAPIKLIFSTGSQSAGSSFQNGKPNLPEPTPTAKTTWSHRPKRCSTSWAAWRTAA